MPKSRCPLCRGSLDMSCHSITNIGALEIMQLLYNECGTERARVMELPGIDKYLAYNGYRNFQKLQHWRLVSEPTRDGIWNVRPYGEMFLLNKLPVRQRVYTWHNRVVDRVGPLLYFRDLGGERQWGREDYAEHAKPVGWHYLNLWWAEDPERWELFRQKLLERAGDDFFAEFDDWDDLDDEL